MSEPTLADIAQQLTDFRVEIKQELELVKQELKNLTLSVTETNKRLDTLDSRLFDFSMRIVTTNQSAFWSISIALLSAAIAFVVARISGGSGF